MRRIKLALILLIAAWGVSTPPYTGRLAYVCDGVIAVFLAIGIGGWVKEGRNGGC